MKWTADKIPDQSGRTAIVTGANSGIGFEAARALAGAGAHVVLACRNQDKATAAKERIEADAPKGSVEIASLDLSDLASVRAFAEAFKHEHDALHLLINNAGVMMPADRQETLDGFELQFGVNHLGHFALTALLMDAIAKTPGARIVTVSSQAHRQGRMSFEDPNWQSRRYKRMASYGQSKLANLMFTFELQRRLCAAGIEAKAVAAHPGWTATDLQRHTPGFSFLNRFFAMPTEQGALPTLRAAVDDDVEGGEYFGPRGFYEMRGYPEKVGTAKQAADQGDAAKLWAMSERLTEVLFPSAQSIA